MDTLDQTPVTTNTENKMGTFVKCSKFLEWREQSCVSHTGCYDPREDPCNTEAGVEGWKELNTSPSSTMVSQRYCNGAKGNQLGFPDNVTGAGMLSTSVSSKAVAETPPL